MSRKEEVLTRNMLIRLFDNSQRLLELVNNSSRLIKGNHVWKSDLDNIKRYDSISSVSPRLQF